ncbi:hypothetical protein GKZ28_06965 [Clostridium chromiireducens]|uniref:Uncharacterized protein n=1 Tax=Clostridium chromiireducens TaxID=225345 RepID=A0A964RKI9_9CLOT|nr:hypothetical protein [Clostridium chromiireducens]MVX63433.1 hypothetical protein [Clostridium chromiireducens]
MRFIINLIYIVEDIKIHQMSTTALIIALAILVDDASEINLIMNEAKGSMENQVVLANRLKKSVEKFILEK